MSKKSDTPINIAIMAVGGRGANVMERLVQTSPPDVKLVAIGARGKTFDRLVLKDKIELSGSDSAITEDGIRQKISDHQAEIQAIFEKTNILFLLGNSTGTESAVLCDEIVKHARAKGVLSFFIGATPFAFEGRVKQKLAEQNLAMLNNSVDGVLTIDSEKFFAANTSAQDALTKVDQTVVSMIEAIIDLVKKCGVVNVDFADLQSTVEKAGAVFFNTISVPRADISTIGKRLFSETCLQQSVKQLQKALYVIYGGADILMEEVSAIGKMITDVVGDDARIIFGVTDEGERRDELKVVFIGA